MRDVSALDIKKALAKKHGNNEFFITECKTGPTGIGMLQFDGLAIYKSWAHPNIVGYEIKVSRSDFLKDAKYTRYMPYCHQLYFVTPTGMVQRQEIEDNLGLIWYNPTTGRLTTKRKAIYRNIEISSDLLLYVIMNRLESDRLPFTSDKAEYWREWVNEKISNKKLGRKVKSKLLDKIAQQEEELYRLRGRKELQEELDAIDGVMRKHGIQTYWERSRAIDQALDRAYPAELDVLHSILHNAVNSLSKIKHIYEKEQQRELL